MRYYCIYEINKQTKESSFVENFDEHIIDAQEFCFAINNFAPADVYYCVRCLDSSEFLYIDNYNPILTSLVL